MLVRSLCGKGKVNRNPLWERDKARIDDAESMRKIKVRALRIALLSASAQVILKGLFGFWTGSLALLATALDSLGDLLNVGLALIAVALGARPPDRVHQFGHGKIESMGAIFQAALVLPIAGGLVWQSVRRLTVGGAVSEPLPAMIVAALMIGVGAVTARFLQREAESTDSPSLRGSALTFKVDTAIHLGVLVALGVVEFIGWMPADAIASILVAVYIVVSSLGLTLKVGRDLLDTRIPAEYLNRIEEELDEHRSEFLDYHRLRTRQAGPEKHIDFHLTICRYRTLEETHRLVDHIENALEAIIPQSQVIIHVDPCVPGTTCRGEDVCMLAHDRRHMMPDSEWPSHPVGSRARKLEREQHFIEHQEKSEDTSS